LADLKIVMPVISVGHFVLVQSSHRIIENRRQVSKPAIQESEKNIAFSCSICLDCAALVTMARKRQEFYQTIEYIGPRPQKPKKRNFFGGWVILVIAVGIGVWFGRPLVPVLKASQQGGSMEQAALLISTMEKSTDLSARLAAAALAYAGEGVVYDASYYKISYPNGDIAPGKGSAADVIIRCYRKLGIDLQQLVHEDMSANFRPYPQLWGASAPDPSIDHRRIPNLERFFERNGEALPASRQPLDYRSGDLVVWSLATGDKHIGIVVPGSGNRTNERWVVHHKDGEVKWEDALFNYKIESAFRYTSNAH
jgi:uncharacterized protein YijF (DUF1287 family)